MARMSVRVDSRGVGEILQSGAVRRQIESLGSSVARNVSGNTVGGEPIEVEVRMRTASGPTLSARPAVDLTMLHPAALAVEAKRAPLARAAAAAGLEVKRKRSN